LEAQFGLQVGTEKNSISFIDPVENVPVVPQDYQTFQAGLEYWFKLKGLAIEFLPSVLYSFGEGKVDFPPSGTQERFNETGIRLQIPILVYPFQFKEDCNCPTFSKQGGFFEDGFHFIVEPGVQYTTRKLIRSESHFIPYAKLGVGLDIAVSKLGAISPQLLYGYYFKDPILNDLSATGLDPSPKIRHSAIAFGIRYILRLDYRRR
jgi:hypothetical protein